MVAQPGTRVRFENEGIQMDICCEGMSRILYYRLGSPRKRLILGEVVLDFAIFCWNNDNIISEYCPVCGKKIEVLSMGIE